MKKVTSILLGLALLAACGINPATFTQSPDVTPLIPTAVEVPSEQPTSTEAPTPTEVYVPRQVELVFAPDGTTVPESCKVVPEATAENTLTLDGQPLPDGTVIDSYQAYTGGPSGTYNQPTLLIAARAVAIEKLATVQLNNKPVDRYLLCYNVKLASGDTIVIASVYNNTGKTGLYTLPGTDVADVTLDQTAAYPTPLKIIHGSDFIALFTSEKIIGQQVLLQFNYDYPTSNDAFDENPWRGAIVSALKAGRLPSGGYMHSEYITPIGGGFVVPESLVP